MLYALHEQFVDFLVNSVDLSLSLLLLLITTFKCMHVFIGECVHILLIDAIEYICALYNTDRDSSSS